MTARFDSQHDLDLAIRALGERDPVMAELVEAGARPTLRRHAPGFEGLARIVTGQQVSTASAAAIWAGSRRASAASRPRPSRRRAMRR